VTCLTGDQEQEDGERRAALRRAVERLRAEAGDEGAALVDPALVRELIEELGDELAAAIDQRTATGPESVDVFVDTLIDAAVDVFAPWDDALRMVSAAMERTGDFEQWSALAGRWVGAIERAVVRAQARGLVDPRIDAALTALVLRDALERTARATVRFASPEYREATAALLRAALRPQQGQGSPTG